MDCALVPATSSLWPLPRPRSVLGRTASRDTSVPVAPEGRSAVHVLAQLKIHFSAFTGREMYFSDVQLRTEFKKASSCCMREFYWFLFKDTVLLVTGGDAESEVGREAPRRRRPSTAGRPQLPRLQALTQPHR